MLLFSSLNTVYTIFKAIRMSIKTLPGLFTKKFIHEQGKLKIVRKSYIDTMRK